MGTQISDIDPYMRVATALRQDGQSFTKSTEANLQEARRKANESP
jgi:hypothetical protein